MGNAGPVSALDYELYVLHVMVDAPAELVDETLHRAGVGRDAYHAAQRRVRDQNYIMLPAFEEVSRILGPPLREETAEEQGHDLQVRTFPLRLWDGYAFAVYGRGDGMIWSERFVRTEDSPPSLEPWRMTKAEAEADYGPLEEEDLWPPYEAYRATIEGRRYLLVFSWSLLQAVTEIRDA
ncbi:hypothetical protein [Actinomadura parmotrematis]|uniref:Uncharacterized protein n=1 Tax=Actinomadura parmotrematis TaxID=2864039 RepID=A0ABS7FNK0_9ACTN|nr:hypothetical protein [Actinomadura parmotrematis]MBW8481955.1 hypothetical protein [Actinomadura parmotrematis]